MGASLYYGHKNDLVSVYFASLTVSRRIAYKLNYLKEKAMNKEKRADLSSLLRPYENKWVALSMDNSKVIESGSTLDDLLRKLKGKDTRDLEFLKVPNFQMCYAPDTKI